MIDNIPRPNTYRKEYLEAASRVRVNQSGDNRSSSYKPISKSIAKEVSKQVKVQAPPIQLPINKLDN